VAVFLQAIVDYPFSRPALGSWPVLIIAMLAARRSTTEEPALILELQSPEVLRHAGIAPGRVATETVRST
jgi:hypothetical protein